MSANFYLSSHANNHLHPHAALLMARVDDLRHASELELAWIEIWSASTMQKICKRLGLRQQVLATAIVFFRRFYLRNAYCDTDPALVAATCCYLAAKAEETPVHVKTAASEAKTVFNDMGLTSFTSDNHRLAEMEFYLIEELDFHLIVYHPYRALVQLCGREGGAVTEASTEQKAMMLEMDDTSLQMAWFIINDTFRCSLCLVHPPHLIALASIYLALALHPPASAAAQILGSSGDSVPNSNSTANISSRTRRRSIDTTASAETNTGTSTTGRPDPIAFLASLQVDQSLVLEIVQEIISLYDLWSQLESTGNGNGTMAPSPAAQSLGVGASARLAASNNGTPTGTGKASTPDDKVIAIIRRMQEARMRELREERSKQAAARKIG
ncbi:hypothetical protein JCM10908_006934 [Rhodotorula pacifica]|uniref:uncharacterized protein n=1 Tax=Rhodotorula pacifica TaxID=1495444 RepID=UPI00317AB217